MGERLQVIPIAKIRENPVALRAVNRNSEEYLGLVESIRIRGVMNPINVREIQGDNGELIFSLVDGLQRYTASQDAGLTDIPAQVMNMSDGEVLIAQIMANVHKVETLPAQYSKQLLRILGLNPLLTISQLSSQLGKTPKWLTDRLSLVKLAEPIQALVDENKVNLTNAYALSKLEKDEQTNFLDRAMTMQPQEFVPLVNQRVKEIRDARRAGRDEKPEEFTPVARLQKVSEIKSEMEKPMILPALIKRSGITDPLAAAQLALKWVMHLDEMSMEADKQKWENRKQEREVEKKRKEQEKLEKKQAEAIKTQQEAAQKLAEMRQQNPSAVTAAS